MQVDLILTADWHLREANPVCRLDNFCEETQWRKVKFIADLQKQHNCPVIHAGDLFDYWKSSPELLSKTIEHLPNQFYTVYGNHDLPQHNINMIKKSGLYTLQIGGNVEVRELSYIEPIHWGMIPFGKEDASILVWHIFTYQGKEPFPGCSSLTAKKLLKKYPQYHLIVTGDNHQSFIEEYEGRLLVNPGSIFRMDADQIEHKPRVYLYYASTNSVEPIYIPIKESVISREHIDVIKERDNRIHAFITQLNIHNWKAGFSFEENIKRFEQKNDVRKSVMEIVYKSIEL
jgi:DNA repair exonuclease SbcCD nuclease subunit